MNRSTLHPTWTHSSPNSLYTFVCESVQKVYLLIQILIKGNWYFHLLRIVFSLSVASNFRSSRFLSLPGASAIGKEEWNTNNLPQQSAFYFKSLYKLIY